MARTPVFPTLMALFGVVLVGRTAEGLWHLDVQAAEWSAAAATKVAEAPPPFAELDAWEEELAVREREVEARAIASDIALAEAKRHAAVASEAKAVKEKKGITQKRMAAVYAAMDPVKAAGALAGLPHEKAAGVIATMNPDVAGAILSAMPVKTSQAVVTAMVAD